MDEDDEEEDGELYEFVTTGEHSCERCMALAGSQWREPPNPPHAHCECEVVPLPSGVHRQRDCGDTTWSIEHIPGSGTVRYGAGGLDGFEWGFTATIDCWDGLSHEFEIWLDMGNEDDYGGALSETLYEDLMAYAWSELYDEIEAVVARVCRPCSPELLS
jgi:hypothetical protein